MTDKHKNKGKLPRYGKQTLRAEAVEHLYLIKGRKPSQIWWSNHLESTL